MKYEIIKTAVIDKDEVEIVAKVRFKRFKGYQGYDIFPDDQIGNALTALGRTFNHDKKWSKIKRKFKNG